MGHLYQFIVFDPFHIVGRLLIYRIVAAHGPFRLKMTSRRISNDKSLLLTKAVWILSAPFSTNGHSTTTWLEDAITSLWRYAQLCNYVTFMTAPWLLFLLVSIPQNDQTDTLLPLSEWVTLPSISILAFDICFESIFCDINLTDERIKTQKRFKWTLFNQD